MPIFSAGGVVIYKTRPAVITAVAADKIEIRTASGDAKSVRPKDVEFLHRGDGTPALPANQPDMPDRGELADLMEDETFSFSDFTDLAFGADTKANACAAYELLSENLYFTGSVKDGVKVRDKRELEAMLEKLSEKEAAQKQRADFLDRVRNNALLPDDAPFLRDVEMVALGDTANSKTMRELDIEATPEKAQHLLLRVGYWNDFTNPWPHRFGVEPDNPELELPPTPDEPRTDLTPLVAFAIDDADSHDPDDAISFADGLLYVHVADPAAVVVSGSELDRVAAGRGSNLYIPETTSHMLPEAATARFGLGLNPESPAITFAIRIGDDGEASLEKMMLSTVRVTRLTYENAAEHWDAAPLADIRLLLDRFKRRRAADGALFIQLPEVKIKVRGEEIEFTPVPITPVRELVANSMLAAGSAVAKYALEHDIPLPFVVQPPPETDERGDSLPAMFKLRRNCLASSMNTTGGLHAGLGLSPYVRVTSPLRRYCDLLAHQQLRRVIKNEPPFDFEYMDERIAASLEGSEARRKLERQCNEFWTLVYLKRHPESEFEAILVFEEGDRRIFLIPELAYEYKTRYAGKVKLGQTATLKLIAADPAALTARFNLV